MKPSAFWLFPFVLLDAPCSGATLDEWRSRSIYQVLTDRFAWPNDSISTGCAVEDGLYCGGTWSGIQSKLDYIQGMNFNAIWISPVVAQLPQQTADGEAYTAYWQQDLYTLNRHFGAEDDLHNLVNDVHERGMLLMLDIVVNHMGYAGVPTNIDYGVFNPFNDQKYFHDYCQVTDPLNKTNIEECWLGDEIVPLADLRTEDQDVKDLFGEWISGMVKNYSIDGLRIDTSINVDPPFFVDFVHSAGVFATGEVMQGDCPLACTWATAIGSILNYPIYYPLTRAFQSPGGSINDLVETIVAIKAICGDPTVFGSFSENHDVPRFASYTSDFALAQNIITYTFMADGIPIIYQGQEQHMTGGISPYYNRAPLWWTEYDTSAPLYKHVATLNKFRQHVMATSTNYSLFMTEVIYQDYHSLGLRKGFNGTQVITILNNNGAATDAFNLPVEGHDFPPGTQVTEILTCTTLTVNASGFLNVPMGAGEPKVMYPTSLLYNSSLCSMPESAPQGTLTTISVSYSTTVDGHPTEIHTVSVSSLAATTMDEPSTRVSAAAHTRTALGAASHMRVDGCAWLTKLVIMVALALA